MSSRIPVGQIEILESRIAPAIIFAGRPNSDDTEYADAPFVPTLAPGSQISDVVGHDPNVYFIVLNPGDVLKKFDNAYTDFISGPNGTPLQGTVVAFFVDKVHGADPVNGEMDADELTGLALGAGVSVQVSGVVNGDVVSNFNEETKTLGGAAEAGTAFATELLLNEITLFAADSVTGKIISGGAINGINVTNDAGSIITGRAADGVTYDFNGAVADGGDTLVVANVAGAKGVNISNVSAGSVTLIESGAGGFAANGGDITNVTLLSDTNGLTIRSGAGGDGGGGGKTTSGSGGKVTKIVVNGLDENLADPTANDLITIASGNGGLAAPGGKAGNGGDMSGVSIGYELKNGNLEASLNALADRVLVQSGTGGAGNSGGKGGKLSDTKVFAAPTGAGNNIDIISGDGGASLVGGGTAGAGGDIVTLNVQNPSLAAPHDSFVKIHSGSGGATAGGVGKGNKGGLINDVDLIAFSIDISTGDGTDGSAAAGAGGDMTDVFMTSGFLGVRADKVILNAGHGGSSTGAKGGKGGTIGDVTTLNAELTQFDINQTAGTANGGTGPKGGGSGGAVNDLSINDVGGLSEVTIHLRSGTGASGAAGGAFGGTNVIFASKASLELVAGAGGAALVNKKGGAGGGIQNLTFSTAGTVGGIAASANLDAGAGGAGDGKGAGGAGGGFKNVGIQAPGIVDVAAGAGGTAGAAGGAGLGGGISALFGVSGTASITLAGGNAGAGGVKGGAGGAIEVANLRAATNITITSGNGSAGGAGGDIKDTTFSDFTGTTGPGGAVSLTAGAGSGAGKSAGAGGNISGAVGYLGQALGNQLIAGLGGAVATKAAAGGSVTDVSIKGGGAAGADFIIEAGNAVVSMAKKGGAGGNVKDVAIDDLAVGTVIQRIAAGAGGDTTVAKGQGGLGGSVTNVQADTDIGVRSGVGFGYTSMGGIFAGQAGLSGAGGKAALAGSVVGISADAIASIVAGRPDLGDAITARNLVQKVDGIYLNDIVATVVDANGTYTNFGTANLVGGVVNPGAVGVAYPAAHPHANTFDIANAEFGDTDASGEFSLGDTITANTDGFVAAVFFDPANSNVQPEAIFRTDPVTGFGFYDLNNLNGQTIVI